MRKALLATTLVIFFVTVALTALAAATEDEPMPEAAIPQAQPTEEGTVVPAEPAPEPLAARACSVVLECPEGCFIYCSGASSCSKNETSVTCDGSTITCAESPWCSGSF